MLDSSLPRRKRLGFAVLLGASVACAAMGGYRYGEHRAAAALQDAEGHKLDLYVDSLQGQLARYASLPAVIAQSHEITELARAPRNARLLAAVDDYLHRVNAQAQASASYLMDTHGHTVAASNWQARTSFVGLDFSYRPYFTTALQGTAGHFFAIGAAGAEPGYYFSTPVRDGSAILGVVAVKINLDGLHESWMQGEPRLLVVDDNGIAFLSTVPAWRYKSLAPLSPTARENLIATRQYNRDGVVGSLDFREIRRFAPDAVLVDTPGVGVGADMSRAPARYLAQTRAVPQTGWRVVVLSSIAPIVSAARTAALLAAFAVLFLASVIVALHQRRMVHRQARLARRVLERAKLELEDQVFARTRDLRESNERLSAQVQERVRAEEALQSATQGLVQAAKLATLGEMSAGITHELNQPLAALQTLSDNAIKMMDRGLTAEARANLGNITQVVMRMAKITGQLRKFARKAPVESLPVAVGGVIGDALFLMEQRLRQEAVTVYHAIDGAAVALCDANRLEQVLINLMANAIDAMDRQATKIMTIAVDRRPGEIVISIRDTGSGIAPEVRERLYEPFFSTKRQGVGLGLGLTISLGIVREFGGSITTGANDAGAEFIVTLKAA
ncbi:MAG: ATP-binding protein [Janthinobacterium lividum]